MNVKCDNCGRLIPDNAPGLFYDSQRACSERCQYGLREKKTGEPAPDEFGGCEVHRILESDSQEIGYPG